MAVRFGKTLVIQEVDGVEPILYPILRGDLISQGETTTVYCILKDDYLIANEHSVLPNESNDTPCHSQNTQAGEFEQRQS